MTQHTKTDFGLAATGYTKATIAAALAAFMSLSSAAIAQEDRYTEETRATPNTHEMGLASGRSEDQNDLLMEYFQFFQYMQSENSMYGNYDEVGSESCCHMRDGIANVDFKETGDPSFPYVVTLTHTQYGIPLSEPFDLKISASHVLSAEHALKVCEPHIEHAEAQGVDHTCEAPPFAAVWIYDGSSYNPGTNTYSFNNRDFSPGEVLDIEEYKETHKNVYCFWPAPDQF